MIALLVAALVAVLGLAAHEWVRILRSVYQLGLPGIAPSDRQSARPASSPQAGHDSPALAEPHRHASSRGYLHSSPPVLAVPLAAIDPAPNMSAFGAGLEVIVFTVLFSISALLVLNWIIKTMKGSD